MRQKQFVLLVEDDLRLRKVIAANLSARGYLVFQAGSFREATDQLAAKPQLMILDIHLPDATGWDVAQWAKEESIAVPTIVISGFPPDQRELQRLGKSVFLSKPFAMRSLIELVRAYAPAN